MPIGRLKIFDTERGFGFIREEGGGDIFLHVTSLFDHGVDPYTLTKGDRLAFDVGRGRDGRPAATNVRSAE
jgi:CspA family cold shock protein